MKDALVSLHGVAKSYDAALPIEALRPTSLDIFQSDLAAIIGPSGSGKSTLLNMLGLLDRPTAGQIFIEGHDTQCLTDDDLAGYRSRYIGFVFQAFHLLEHRTALENVRMGLMYAQVPRAQRAALALEALAKVGLHDRRGSDARLLSGGEKQRLAIARALAARPSYILCDEPTGNLDSFNARRILDLLCALTREGSSVIIVTHSSEVAARCDRVLSVFDGVVAEEAAHVA